MAAELLEKLYCCEINCVEMDRSVLLAHHARGCTVIASKICENTVIYQNVTIGSNMKFNKISGGWENLGNPVIGKNVIIADGAKILGPVHIGDGSVIAAGVIVTEDMPPESLIYGVNRHRPKDPDYDLIFSKNLPDPSKITEANRRLISKSEFYKVKD